MSKFLPGQSGNPAGKKKGTLSKRTQLARLLEPHAEELVAKAVELARNGDVNALRLCIERLIPKANNEQINITLPNLNNGSDPVSEIQKEVLQMLSGEEINLKQAGIVFTILKEYRKVNNPEDEQKLKELMELYRRDY